MTEPQFVMAEALIVQPDEVLVIKIASLDEDDADQILASMNEILTQIGLGDRSFILVGDDIQLAKIKQEGKDTQ